MEDRVRGDPDDVLEAKDLAELIEQWQRKDIPARWLLIGILLCSVFRATRIRRNPDAMDHSFKIGMA